MTNLNNKAVLMSIRPEWCELIASGKKTIEVRKTKPNFLGPFKVYIYCTKKFYRKGNGYFQGKCCGKVIGEFICDRVILGQHGNYKVLPPSETCIDILDLLDYADNKPIYGLHISNLIIYDTPKELTEFNLYDCRVEFENGYPAPTHTIARAPQSWCYVKDLEPSIELCTFPNDDKDYCKVFSVPEKWLINTLETVDSFNERKGVDIENFLDNYIWDETWFIYLQAKSGNKIVWEYEQT